MIEDTDMKNFKNGGEKTLVKDIPENRLARRRARIWEIDFLRGLCVMLMVFDHIMYDFAYIFGTKNMWAAAAGFAGSATERICRFAFDYFHSPSRDAVQPVVAGIFVFLSGISSGFSKSNLKRGVRLAVFAAALTLVTMIMTEIMGFDMVIRFGVLHMLASAMILFGLVELGLKKLIIDDGQEASKAIYHYLSLLTFTAIGILFVLVGGYFQAHPLKETGILAVIVDSNKFYSADYFPVLPWSGLMFLGAVFGRLVYKNKKSLWGNPVVEKITSPINFVGRNSIWFYLTHQVLVFGILYLMGVILGFGG